MSRTAVTKPAPRDREWFDAGSGINKATPSDGLKGSGYVAPAIPDMEHFNYLFQEMEQHLRYYIQRGLPDWDVAETYQAGDCVRYNGFIYVALAPAVATPPATSEFLSTRTWERWVESPFGTPGTDTAPTPIKRWRSNRAFSGSEVDHLGYVGGLRALTEHETWRGDESQVTTGTTIFEKTKIRWNVAVTTGASTGATVRKQQSSSITTRNLLLSIGTGATDKAECESEAVGRFEDQLVFETNVVLGANVNQMIGAFGLLDLSGDLYGAADTLIGCIFRKGNADTNWQAICGDGTARTIVDTGVVAAANGIFDMRIEIQSASFNNGTAAVARFYLNSVLVVTTTTHLPLSAASRDASIALNLARDTGASARSVVVKPVRFATYVS